MNRKEKAMRHVLMILIGVILIASVGGCAQTLTPDERREHYRKHFDTTLTVEEIDDGVYMIAAKLDGHAASDGWGETMKRSVFKKAREHCAQENKAIKVVSQKEESGEYSESQTHAGFLAGNTGYSTQSKPAKFDIVFQCRERTTPAATPEAP